MGTCRFFWGIRIATPACAPVRNDIFLRVRRVSSGGTHGCRPTEDMKVRCISMKSSFRGAKRRGNPFSPHDKKCGAGGYGLPHRRARRFAMTFFESAAGVGGSSGKSAKRRRWRKKRAGFEEVPRLAATTVDGNRLARRWAIADPYGCMARKCGAGEYGLPHRRARRFAMTFFESAAGCENGRGSPPARLACSSYFFIYIPERRGCGGRGGGGLRRPPAR